MKEFCPRCKKQMTAKYGKDGERRRPAPAVVGGITYSPEYQQLVSEILQDARERQKREQREKFAMTEACRDGSNPWE